MRCDRQFNGLDLDFIVIKTAALQKLQVFVSFLLFRDGMRFYGAFKEDAGPDRAAVRPPARQNVYMELYPDEEAFRRL